MHRTRRTSRAASAAALALLVALAAVSAGCRQDARTNANGGAAQAGPTPGAAAGPGAPVDPAKLDAEIERLERQAERNPADEETRHELARAYVRRGDARRGEGKLNEALADYQTALRNHEDNAEAQAGAAAINEQLGAQQREDENGAPVPLPITPGVADEDGKPTPTPKKQ